MEGGGIREYVKKVAAMAKADREAQGRAPPSPGRDYIGVRSRPGNKFGAQILDPANVRILLWLGTYDTAEEAACAYDAAARPLKPAGARLNFPDLWAGEEVPEEREAVVRVCTSRR